MPTLARTTLEHLNRDAPEWVAAWRAAAFATFDTTPLPDPRHELWRYVDIGLDLDAYSLPDTAPQLLEPGELVAGVGTPLAARIADGFVEILDAPKHAQLVSLLDGEHAGLLDSFHSGSPDKLSAAQDAFFRDGVVVHVPKRSVVTDPVVIDVQAVDPAGLSVPRITVDLEEGAEATIVLLYRSAEGSAPLVLPRVEARVGDGGRLAVTTVQAWSRETIALGRQTMRAGRDAVVRFGEVGLGGRWSRLHLVVDLAGRGASGEVTGVYFGDGEQVHDYRYFMNHQAPNTSSDMFLKGAVEDEASSVFTGLIRIEEKAQKTNAFQTNRNLVLSEGAQANSVPNLEILANDVRCGHGSTMGPLDEEQRYYLMSRGLDRVRADRLQVRGFFEEAIRKLPMQALAPLVRERVNAKFVAAQEEGRL